MIITCGYIFLGFWFAHLLVNVFFDGVVTDYLAETQTLYELGEYTDGCTAPLKTYIHRWLDSSRILCAAHDYGGLGLLTTARAGWHNNIITWLAHMYQVAPIYWFWGTIVAVWTLPRVVWRWNLGIKVPESAIGFSIVQTMLIIFYFLIEYKAEITTWTN